MVIDSGYPDGLNMWVCVVDEEHEFRRKGVEELRLFEEFRLPSDRISCNETISSYRYNTNVSLQKFLLLQRDKTAPGALRSVGPTWQAQFSRHSSKLYSLKRVFV